MTVTAMSHPAIAVLEGPAIKSVYILAAHPAHHHAMPKVTAIDTALMAAGAAALILSVLMETANAHPDALPTTIATIPPPSAIAMGAITVSSASGKGTYM